MEKADSEQGEMLKDNIFEFCVFIEQYFFYQVVSQQSWSHPTAAGGHLLEQRYFGAVLSV